MQEAALKFACAFLYISIGPAHKAVKTDRLLRSSEKKARFTAGMSLGIDLVAAMGAT